LAGGRGRAPVDVDAIVAALLALSRLATEREDIVEVDLNPVLAYADRILAVDARVLIDAPPSLPARKSRRDALAGLDRAFGAKTVAVIGDKAMNGFLWLHALEKFRGQLYSVQIDPNEIPAIEAMGVTNVNSLAEVPTPVDYAILAVPRQVVRRVLADCEAA